SDRTTARGRSGCTGHPPTPTTTATARTGWCSAWNWDGGRRELLVEQPPEPGHALGFGGRFEPATEERLPLGIDEHVRAPQGGLDELEPLGGDVRGVPTDVSQVDQDFLVGPAVDVPQDRRVAANGRQDGSL